jgi:hypothetical protein
MELENSVFVITEKDKENIFVIDLFCTSMGIKSRTTLVQKQVIERSPARMRWLIISFFLLIF